MATRLKKIGHNRFVQVDDGRPAPPLTVTARPTKPKKTFTPLPCIHLGPATGETRECPTCTGKVNVKLFGCGIHGQCALDKLLPGVACCNGCKEKVTAERPTAGRAILLTCGIGDAFAVESFMSPEQRASIETIYYACPAAVEIEQLFRALPNFPRLKTHNVIPFRRKHGYRSKVEVEKDHGKIDAEDWSIGKVFYDAKLTYTGSSFLTYRLAEPAPLVVPYVVIVPNSSWVQWKHRPFNGTDWRATFDFLERRNLYGVILYKGRATMPEHHRIINLANKTTICEAVEILKGARGYLGIDSCLSVLAAKLFTMISVKCVSKHGLQWRQRYYAPRTDFGFLTPRIIAPEVL